MKVRMWICGNCGEDFYIDERSGEPEFCPFCKSTDLDEKGEKTII